jgi:hypothetical protein
MVKLGKNIGRFGEEVSSFYCSRPHYIAIKVPSLMRRYQAAERTEKECPLRERYTMLRCKPIACLVL